MTVNGVNENVPNVFDRPLARGEYITASDVDTRRRVAVLGSTLVRRVFGDVDPLGRQVSIAGVRFRVIGVFEKVGSTFGVDRDTEVHIPVTAAQRLFGIDRIDALAVKAPRADDVEPLQRRLVAALQDKYDGEEFSAVTQTQILGTIGRILGLLTLVLAAIAAISLLVGGVGVSNIMLVSVRERTREIGLRKALGARQRDILLQFLIEAVLLCVVGGLIGIGLGVGVVPARRRAVAVAGGHRLVVPGARVRGVRGRRDLLRGRPGAAGRPARPGRGAAHRVSAPEAGGLGRRVACEA